MKKGFELDFTFLIYLPNINVDVVAGCIRFSTHLPLHICLIALLNWSNDVVFLLLISYCTVSTDSPKANESESNSEPEHSFWLILYHANSHTNMVRFN